MKSAVLSWSRVRALPDVRIGAGAGIAWLRWKQELAFEPASSANPPPSSCRRPARDVELCQQEATAACRRPGRGLEREQERAADHHGSGVPRPRNLRNQLAQAEERIGRAGSRVAASLRARSTTAKSQIQLLAASADNWRWNLRPSRSAWLRLTQRNLWTFAHAARFQAPRRKRGQTHGWMACAASLPRRLGKKGSLEAVIAEHGYSTESVRRLFQSGVMQGGLRAGWRAGRFSGSGTAATSASLKISCATS